MFVYGFVKDIMWGFMLCSRLVCMLHECRLNAQILALHGSQNRVLHFWVLMIDVLRITFLSVYLFQFLLVNFDVKTLCASSLCALKIVSGAMRSFYHLIARDDRMEDSDERRYRNWRPLASQQVRRCFVIRNRIENNNGKYFLLGRHFQVYLELKMFMKNTTWFTPFFVL